MASGYTVFISYVFVPISGYSQAIHCNYIKTLQLNTSNPDIEEIRINFLNINDFKFLSDDIANGTGYTANRIYGLIQLINNSGYTSITDVKPIAADWKKIDITNQVTGYTSGDTFILTPAKLTGIVFKIPLYGYNTYSGYTLTYLNYPRREIIDEDKLCFGDEICFLGNITTDIEAKVYTTDLSINLPLNEFNSSTNLTWDNISPVSITEIGIYDNNKNLVAIGKLNDPVSKDNTISRTILFAIDF